MADVGAAVVFVHGLFSSPSIWDGFDRLLRRDDDLRSRLDVLRFAYHTPRFNLRPSRRIPDLDMLATSLGTFLRVEAGGYATVVLVSHSQGGLIVQRRLAQMIVEGRGHDLRRVAGITMFACPNSGSEFLLSVRRLAWFLPNPQERALRPFDASLLAARRLVLERIVYARDVAADRCPIPIKVYAGESDNVVSPVSAFDVFPDTDALPGDHSSIVQPDSPRHRSYTALKSDLLRYLHGAATPASRPAAVAGGSPADGGGPARLGAAALSGIADAFMEIDEVVDDAIRRRLVQSMPSQIKGAYTAGGTTRIEIVSWVMACARYGRAGREALVAALRLALPASDPRLVRALAVLAQHWPDGTGTAGAT